MVKGSKGEGGRETQEEFQERIERLRKHTPRAEQAPHPTCAWVTWWDTRDVCGDILPRKQAHPPDAIVWTGRKHCVVTLGVLTVVYYLDELSAWFPGNRHIYHGYHFWVKIYLNLLCIYSGKPKYTRDWYE